MESVKAGKISYDKSFASGFNFYKLFWIFFIGCIMGVVIETIWCLATGFHFESRTGLIYGPFNPVYGFGALFMTIALYWLKNKSDRWILIGGTIVGAAFEYICSWVQEMIFGTVSWDYSNYPFNLNGRICLLYSLFWGILALVWLKHIFPLMTKYIEKIPNSFGKSLTFVLLIFMIFNVLMSSAVVSRLVDRRNAVPVSNLFERYIDEKYPDERVNKIYPNMRFIE